MKDSDSLSQHMHNTAPSMVHCLMKTPARELTTSGKVHIRQCLPEYITRSLQWLEENGFLDMQLLQEKKAPTLAFFFFFLFQALYFPINVSRKKNLISNSFLGEKKHILSNKDCEHRRTLIVLCGLVDYLFTKYNCGMPHRSKAMCEGLKGY